MGKKVPLVTYNNGVRTVIGEADVEDDGTCTMIVNEPFNKQLIAPIGDMEMSIAAVPMPKFPDFEEVTREVIREDFEREWKGHFQSMDLDEAPPIVAVIPDREIRYNEWLRRGGGSVVRGALPLEFLESLAEQRDNLDQRE